MRGRQLTNAIIGHACFKQSNCMQQEKHGLGKPCGCMHVCRRQWGNLGLIL
ncbi:hypothetical protein PAHAL_3G408500 [Panicum hallii]|uniref:Uncharacterized protein n=1 Tax=Panicum hallii TaxID=206008 RepID=A0A2T8KKW0_9POAL|nr:hypothetical protein PAHAL_3G408500 [Panicum hallii]